MKSEAKHIGNHFLGILVFITAVLVFLSLPLVSYAQTGTLGQESPEIYCTYEQDGVAVDGNNLTAGTYDVNFVLSGMNNLSVFEVTATYDTEQVTVESAPSGLISDDAGMDSMGYILEDGNIVFGFVSTNEDCSHINEYEQIIATVKMTFASDCDAEDYITISDNPNLTFAQADYGDGYDDSYASVESYQDYTGNLYLMTCDVTPEFGHSVKGNIVVMTNSSGSTNGVAVYGNYKIDVYSDKDKSNLVTSVISEQKQSENQIINEFKIDALKDGTYYATISSEYSIPRDITIVISGKDILAGAIPMICCEYDSDDIISANDAKYVYVAAANGALRKYCELDGDGVVSVNDAKIVYILSASSKYNDLIIK